MQFSIQPIQNKRNPNSKGNNKGTLLFSLVLSELIQIVASLCFNIPIRELVLVLKSFALALGEGLVL